MPANLPDPADPTPVVRIPTRPEVRAIVETNRQEQAEAAQRGENVHQLALTQNDRVIHYGRLLHQVHGEQAALDFLRMFREEIEASTAHTIHQTAVAQEQIRVTQATAAQGDATTRAIGSVVVTLALAFLFYLLIR